MKFFWIKDKARHLPIRSNCFRFRWLFILISNYFDKDIVETSRYYHRPKDISNGGHNSKIPIVKCTRLVLHINAKFNALESNQHNCASYIVHAVSGVCIIL